MPRRAVPEPTAIDRGHRPDSARFSEERDESTIAALQDSPRSLPSLTTAFLAAGDRRAEADEPPLERVQTIALKGPVGGMDHLAIDAKRGRLFVANTVNDSLDVVDLKAGKLLKQVPGQGRIRGIDYSPDADRIFVGNGTGGVCNTFDGRVTS